MTQKHVLIYGYGAVKNLNPVARSLVESYTTKIRSNTLYGIGQSNGGRYVHGRCVLVSLICLMAYWWGNPGFNLPKGALQHAWDIQALHRVSTILVKR